MSAPASRTSPLCPSLSSSNSAPSPQTATSKRTRFDPALSSTHTSYPPLPFPQLWTLSPHRTHMQDTPEGVVRWGGDATESHRMNRARQFILGRIGCPRCGVDVSPRVEGSRKLVSGRRCLVSRNSSFTRMPKSDKRFARQVFLPSNLDIEGPPPSEGGGFPEPPLSGSLTPSRRSSSPQAEIPDETPRGPSGCVPPAM